MSKVYVFREFGGPESQGFIDRPAPTPGPGELGIQVRAAGVNPADWKLRAGRMGTSRALPAAMGFAASGVVTEVGEGVADFAVGDEVLGTVVSGQGAFAEDTLMRADAAVAKPEEVTFVDAAALPIAGSTAYDGVHQLDLEAGQTLLILGIGGAIGNMSAQIGNVHKINVIGTASDSKHEMVKSLGATPVAYGPGVADRIRAVAPDGIDAILDLVGGQALRDVADLVTDDTKIVTSVDPATAEELGGAPLARDRTKASLEKITGVVEVGLVNPNVAEVYPLDKAGEALASVESGHSRGKVVIEVSQG